jgi:hypothetical protein
MRYYLDFCHKYQFDRGTEKSLSSFLEKLDQKKQPVQLKQQAEQAVRLYFDLTRSSKKQQDFKNKGSALNPTKIPPDTYSDNLKD